MSIKWHKPNGQSWKDLKASGPFAVRLPGSLQVGTQDFDQISRVYTDSACDGSYIVEFTQEKDARRYKKQAVRACKVSKLFAEAESIAAPPPPPGDEALVSPPGLLGPQPDSLPMPFQKKTQKHGFSESARPMILPAAQIRHEVEVSGLPRNLMSKPMMETILEQAGLEKEMIGFTALNPNLARITLSTEQAAQMCAEHFHNCRWNHHSCDPVIATIVDHAKANFMKQPNMSKQHGYPTWPNKVPMHNHHRVGVSDASTNVSDEEREEEWWVADLVGQSFSV